MSTLDRSDRHRALNFAKSLSEFASKAPDDEIKSGVYSIVNATRKKYGYSRDDKKAEIAYCVGLGAATRDDLVRETPFRGQELHELLTEMVRDGRLRATEAALNKVGPRVTLYFLIDRE